MPRAITELQKSVKSLHHDQQCLHQDQQHTIVTANVLSKNVDSLLAQLGGNVADQEKKLNEQQVLSHNQQQSLSNTTQDTVTAFQHVERSLVQQQQDLAELRRKNRDRSSVPQPGMEYFYTPPILSSTENCVSHLRDNDDQLFFDTRLDEMPPRHESNLFPDHGDSRRAKRSVSSDCYGGSSNLPVISNSKISPPPSFEPQRFLAWRRDFEFWRDLYWYISDSQLLSVTGLSASAVLRNYLIRFVRETRQDPKARSLKNFLDSLQVHFAASNREREAQYLDELLGIHRDSAESIQSFWFRFDELRFRLEGSGIEIPDKMMFLRLMKCLGMTPPMRLSIISTLNCRCLEHSILNLRTVTIELFGVYKEMIGKIDSAHLVNENESEFNETASSTLVARGKARPRKPSMEVNAIRNSMAAANIPNQTMHQSDVLPAAEAPSRVGRCWRCGKTDHLLKQCPMPFTKLLAFAPKRPFNKPGSGLLLTEEEAIALVQNEEALAADSGSTSEIPAVPPNAPCVNDVLEEPPEVLMTDEDWMNRWMEERTFMLTESTSLDKNVPSATYSINDVCPWMADSKNTLCAVRTPNNDCLEYALAAIPRTGKNNSCHSLILDSGATATVAGIKWIRRWMGSSKMSMCPIIQPSMKSFRFGDSRLFHSKGLMIVNGTAPARTKNGVGITREITLGIEIVDTDIPLLLSRSSMAMLGCKLDFENNLLTMHDQTSIPLSILNGGHLSFEWAPSALAPKTEFNIIPNVFTVMDEDILPPGAPNCNVFPVNDNDNDDNMHSASTEPRRLDHDQFLKLHYQMGHADVNAIKRLCTISGWTLDTNEAKEWISNCDCNRCDRIPQMPVVNRHLASFPGEVLMIDVTFIPSTHGGNKPALMMTCPLTRFVSCHFIKDVKPATIITMMLLSWIVLFSYPKVLFCDMGTSFRGEMWEDFCHSYAVGMTCAPRENPNQIGSCEKQSHLIKMGFKAVRDHLNDNWSDEMVLALTCAAHNESPISRGGWTPLYLVTGRPDLLNYPILNNDEASELGQDTTSIQMSRLKSMWMARSTIIKADASHTIKMALKAPLRTGSKETFFQGQLIKCWYPKKQRWITGYRCLADLGRNLVVEMGARIIKVPRQWASAALSPGPQLPPKNEYRNKPGVEQDHSSTENEQTIEDSNVSPADIDDMQVDFPQKGADLSQDLPSNPGTLQKRYFLRSSLISNAMCAQENCDIFRRQITKNL